MILPHTYSTLWFPAIPDVFSFLVGLVVGVSESRLFLGPPINVALEGVMILGVKVIHL